jgi:unsaturated rhamnogalacturonyl hydrolase
MVVYLLTIVGKVFLGAKIGQRIMIKKIVIINVLLLNIVAFHASAQVHGSLWSKRIAQSFLRMHPDSINYANLPKSQRWNYEQGLMLESFYQMWQQSNDSLYLRYIQKNIDYYLTPDGQILTYKFAEFQLDNVTPGKVILRMNGLIPDSRYQKAISTLRRQLAEQPRTSEGGFWHKKVYPSQMWLDGLYMAEPFYALYSETFNDTAAFNDIALQFLLIAKHCSDEHTGLLFHGWDESKNQQWAHKETGCSPNFWGRSIGWYAMALVDVLEFFPEQHPKRNELLRVFNTLANNMLKQRDEQSKLWYQVVDKPQEKGNYLEASVSTMLAYTFAKGANLGYLAADFQVRAQETFQGVLDHCVTIDDSGIVHLEHTCSVSGLGGKPYRDGSVAYYLSEPQRTDDFKGYGPFLLAAIEIEKSKDKK